MSQQPQTPYQQTYGDQSPQGSEPQQPGQPQGVSQPQQPASPYSPPAPPYPTCASEPSKGKATAALICGILAIFLSWIPFVGIILGIVGIVLAGSYIKGGGSAGTAKAGRVCGIVGLVFSVIVFTLTLLLAFGIIDAYDDYDDYHDSDFSTHHVVDLSAEEQIASKVVTSELDKIKTLDPTMMSQIAALGEDGFKQMTGLTMEQCGIDPNAYAQAMARGFDYRISLVLADHDWENGGFVAVDAVCVDTWDVRDDFSEAINSRSVQNELAGLSDAAAKKRIGEIFMQAVNGADLEDEIYVSVDIVYVSGAWVMDPDSWNEELEYCFGL